MYISLRAPLFSLVFLMFSVVFAAHSFSCGTSFSFRSIAPKSLVAEGTEPVPKTPPTKPPTSSYFSA